ncbi:hypothetical protein MSP8886_04187 [Marinomonas spartinae]|uniref:Uncharacterized protein n=1 Tax=Marinomonas spartinae TaxID=1792290 RepID=A0A1A8TT66_9GAMM|nr:hypothetical protein [Marinomonas spartinae]SBS37586.1 hypothetical protein MSP8886_04187 [Marinomonas spartinae]
MFGLKKMQRERDRLFEKTQQLEKQATTSRNKAKDSILAMAVSPTGLLASFVLGATTQCDISKKARQNLLNGATKEVLGFLSSQVMAYMSADSQKTPASEEEEAPSQTDRFSQDSPASPSKGPSTTV